MEARSRHTPRRVTRKRIAAEPATTPLGGSDSPEVNYELIAPEGDSPAIKLTEGDAERIEQSSGLPPEQMEESDLEETMQELEIQSEPLTPADERALGIRN
jgi:hypothetical protein